MNSNGIYRRLKSHNEPVIEEKTTVYKEQGKSMGMGPLWEKTCKANLIISDYANITPETARSDEKLCFYFSNGKRISIVVPIPG